MRDSSAICRPLWRFILSSTLLALTMSQGAWALSCVMIPVSAGTDGPFNVVSMDGKTVYQGAATSGGNYSPFMYFKRPSGVNFTAGATLYMEVDYKDTGGQGRIGCQYD